MNDSDKERIYCLENSLIESNIHNVDICILPTLDLLLGVNP